MTKQFILLSLAFVVFVSGYNAQVLNEPRKSASTLRPVIEPFPENPHHAFLLILHADESLTLNIADSEGSQVLARGTLGEALSQSPHFKANRAETGETVSHDTVGIVQSSPTLTWGNVVGLIQELRKSFQGSIWVEATSEIRLAVPPEPNVIKPLIPHPLTLVVEFDRIDGPTLNGERERSLEDLSVRLRDIFLQRTTNDVRSGGTQKIEKSVFIKMPRTTRFEDVISIAKALQEAGADPIGLQVDDLDR